MAGVKTSKLVEAHGTFFTASCISCKSKQDSKIVKVMTYDKILLFACNKLYTFYFTGENIQ